MTEFKNKNASDFNLFHCVDLTYEINRRQFKLESVDMGGLCINATYPYMCKQTKIKRRLIKDFEKFGCQKYEQLDLVRLSKLREESITAPSPVDLKNLVNKYYKE